MSTIAEIYGLRRIGDKEVGIEIEMEGQNLRDAPNYWTSHMDGSLRGESIEYVLTKPVTRDNVAKVLRFLQNHLKETGATLTPSDRCGVHVHVNCQDLTFTQTLNYMLLYLIFEDLMVAWCGEDREGNLFCLRTRDAEGLIHGLRRCCEVGQFNHVANDTYRYGSINPMALQRYGSLEFRAMRTPKDFAPINTWAEALLRIKDRAVGYDKPFHIVENLSAMGSSTFLNAVFGPLAEQFQHRNSHRWIMEGVRRIQDVAYTPISEGKAKGTQSITLDEFNRLVGNNTRIAWRDDGVAPQPERNPEPQDTQIDEVSGLHFRSYRSTVTGNRKYEIWDPNQGYRRHWRYTVETFNEAFARYTADLTRRNRVERAVVPLAARVQAEQDAETEEGVVPEVDLDVEEDF